MGEGESQRSSEDSRHRGRKKGKNETATMALNLLQACSPHNGNGKVHFHDSRWTFPLMDCKSLERQMSYFCGLNGSFDFLMLERENKWRQREKKRSDKGYTVGGIGFC